MESVKVVCIRNPFDPLESREIREIPYSVIKTARGYTAEFFPAYIDLYNDGSIPVLDLVISVNGLVLPDDSDRIIRPGDSIVFCAVPHGEGGAKNIFGIIAMLAIMLVAMPIGAGLAGAMGPGMGIVAGSTQMATLTSIMTGVTMVGMSSAVNAMFRAVTDTYSGIDATFSKSPTYGWSVGGNVAVPGGAVPTLFGTHRIVPPKIAQYLSQEGQNQYLNMLFAVAAHEIDSITSVRINEQPAENFTNIDISFTLGTNDIDHPIPFFGDVRSDIPVSTKITTDYITRQTTTEVDGFAIGLIAPQGLWNAKNDGSIGENSVYLEFEYRKVGAADWVEWMGSDWKVESLEWWRYPEGDDSIDFAFVDLRQRYPIGTEVKFVKPGSATIYTTVTNVKWGQSSEQPEITWTTVYFADDVMEWGGGARLYYLGAFSLSGSETSPLRWYIEMYAPDDGLAQYEYRFRFTEAPFDTARYGWEIYVEYQQESLKASMAYPNTACLGVRALATDQLSGAAPKVDCIATRSTVPVWTGAAYEDKAATSPAWASWHILHDSLNGGGIPASRIVFDAYDEWDDFCTEKDLTNNIYFDSTMNLKKALDIVGVLGRGQTVQMGSKFTALVEKPETPIQRFMFGAGNIKASSLLKEWLPSDSRADEVEITYWDADREWEPTALVVQQVGFDDIDEVPKTLSIMFYGCTDRDMAASYARFLLNKNKYLTLTTKWEADVDSLGCVIGDVVDLGHDLTEWGASGRVVTATTTTVVLDKEVTMEGGQTYVIDIKHADDTREERVVSVDVATTTDTLTVDPVWTAVPEMFDIFSFGLQTGHVQPVWVLGIERTGDQKANLYGLEYVEEVFDDEEIIPVVIPPEQGLILGLTATEAWVVGPEGSAKAVIDLSWRDSVGMSWIIYIRIYNDNPLRPPNSYSTVGVSLNTIYRIEWNLTLHETYEIAVSRTGPAAGSTALVTITGKGWLPSNVTNVTATTVSTGILIAWELILEVDVREYILQEGADWDSAEEIYRGLSSNYLWRITVAAEYDFWVKVVDTSGQECDVPGYVRHYIELPEAVALSFSFVGNGLLLYWTPSSGDFPIIEYLISYGDSHEESVEVARTKGTTWTAPVSWGGTRRFWVAAIDAAGNLGFADSVDAIAAVPSAVRDISPQVVHNNVLLRWTEPETHTLPILSYQLKKGDFIESAELLGELFATFAAQQEIEAGTYRYWLAAKDTAGNVGVWSSITVSVTAPIGYVLRHNEALDLSGLHDVENDTVTTSSSFVVIEHSGAGLIPVIRDETWEEHFVDNSWPRPEDQLDEGYFLYAHPANSSGGYWQQVIDLGVLLPGSRVTLVNDITIRDGAPESSFTVSTSEDDITYDEYGGLLEFYSLPFRYVRVRLEVNTP